MTQLRSKFDLEDLEEKTEDSFKSLPNSFEDSKDEISLKKSILISVVLHPLTLLVLWLIMFTLTLLGIDFSKAQRPEWKKKDIEFVLVTNEAEPINKNTKYRSDKNSRAGGKHDPTRKVSEPSPSPAPKANKAPAPTPAPPAPVKQPQPKPQPKTQQIPQVQKPVVKQVTPAPKAAVKPSSVQAPVQRPSAKPAAAPPKAAMPKLVAAPKSPFAIATPKTTAPVGPRPSTGTGTSTTSGGGSTSGGGASRGTGMPSPQLSPSRGGSSTGTRAGNGPAGSRGTGYGTGNMGNPGPGNPSGPPGIDAVKSPNWGPYMRELERKIKRNWNPPKGDASKRVVMLFKIGRDGRLLSIRVGKSSGSIPNDDAAKAAIELTAPFQPLPPEFKGSSIDIEFTFDYNVLGASYR